jgi:DNA-binding CsgD family transcriptional regulator
MQIHREDYHMRAGNRGSVGMMLLLAVLAFSFYSIVNVYQSPLSIGDTTSQSTMLSLSKSLTALAFALLAALHGLRFKHLLFAWVASVLFFALTPVIAQLAPTPFSGHLYYLALGMATSLGLVTLATLFADFRWQQARWILLIRHFLARMTMFALILAAFTDVKTIVLIAYALFTLTLVLMIIQRTRSAEAKTAAANTGAAAEAAPSPLATYDIAPLSFLKSPTPHRLSKSPNPSNPTPSQPSRSLTHRLPFVKMAFALGGAALSPFILGLFESVANMHGFAYNYSPTITLVITLVTTLSFAIAFALKKEIDIDAAFLVISAASIVFIIWILFDSRLSSSLYSFLQMSATFYHVALWLFIFKQGAQKTIHPAIAIGISVGVISLARMSGYAISTAALSNALPNEVVNSITLWSLAVFALVNFTLFIITLRVQNLTWAANELIYGDKDETASLRDSPSSPLNHSPSTSSDDLSDISADDVLPSLDSFCKRHSLTTREAQILARYTSGRSADVIAKRYHLSTHTVKTYIARIYRKLNVHSRQELLDLIESEAPRLPHSE